MIFKQALLAFSLILGGGVVAFALMNNDQADDTSQVQTGQASQTSKPVAQPLTADAATEERLLAQKQQQRQEHERQLKQQTEILLAEQEKARMNALDKAQAERSGVDPDANHANASSAVAVPVIQTRPEAIEAANKAEEEKRQAQEKSESQKQDKAEVSNMTAKADSQKSQSKKEAANKPENKNLDSQKAENKKPEQSKKDKKPDDQKAESKKPEQVKKDKKSEDKTSKSDGRKASGSGEHHVKRGETWTSIARRYGVSVAQLTAANGVSKDDILRADKTIKLPSGAKKADKQDKSKQQTKQNQQDNKNQDRKKSDAKKSDAKKPDAKKPDAKTQDSAKQKSDKGKYSVQVSLSSDKQKVAELVEQYRAAGYQVTTSNTSRGVRVLVGGGRSEAEAKALRNKIAQDSRVKSDGAWVRQSQ